MEDYKSLFSEVASLLNENGYGLVVEQVKEELSTGRLSGEKIKTLKEVQARTTTLWETRDFKASQPADFVRREDYSDEEALILLLEAAKRAVVDPAAMVAEIQTVFASFGINEIVLEPEGADKGQAVDLSNGADLEQARKHAEQIDSLARKEKGTDLFSC